VIPTLTVSLPHSNPPAPPPYSSPRGDIAYISLSNLLTFCFISNQFFPQGIHISIIHMLYLSYWLVSSTRNTCICMFYVSQWLAPSTKSTCIRSVIFLRIPPVTGTTWARMTSTSTSTWLISTSGQRSTSSSIESPTLSVWWHQARAFSPSPLLSENGRTNETEEMKNII